MPTKATQRYSRLESDFVTHSYKVGIILSNDKAENFVNFDDNQSLDELLGIVRSISCCSGDSNLGQERFYMPTRLGTKIIIIVYLRPTPRSNVYLKFTSVLIGASFLVFFENYVLLPKVRLSKSYFNSDLNCE